jgi:hypothetical protein
MKHTIKGSQVVLTLVAVVLVTSTLLVNSISVPALAQGRPTAVPTEVEAGEGETAVTTPNPKVSGGSGFELPATFEDILKENPELQGYLDKLAATNDADIDFAELYNTLFKIYTTQGIDGVVVFMRDSKLLERLNIPVEYLDLLLLIQEQGIETAITEAQAWGIISDNNEIVVFLLIKSDDLVPAVTDSVTRLQISTYSYNAETGELEIGIPLAVIGNYGTAGALLGFFAQVGIIDGVEGARVPHPNLQPSKK